MDIRNAPFGRWFYWLDAAWRWSRARHLVQTGWPLHRRRDDEWIAAARKYLLLAAGEDLPAPRSVIYRHVSAAAELAAAPMLTRLKVEARILAGLDNETIAQRAKLPQQVVEAFELLFCDCRQQLQAEGWIRNCVIHSEGMPQGVPTMRGALLLMSYYGGEQVTEDVLESLQRTDKYLGNWSEVNKVDNGLTDLDCKLLFTLEMLTRPVTQKNVLRFLKEAAIVFGGNWSAGTQQEPPQASSREEDVWQRAISEAWEQTVPPRNRDVATWAA